MDFYQQFAVLSDPSSTEINQANEFLNTILEENPTQFILNLIEIIQNEEVPVNIRKSAINSLTIPIKRKNGFSFRNPNVDFSAIIQPIFETLHILLSLDDENDQSKVSLGNAAVYTFVIYANSLLIEESVEIINSIFEKITEGIPDFYLIRLLTITSQIKTSHYSPDLVPQYMTTLATLFASFEYSNESKHFFLLTVEKIIGVFDLTDVAPEFTGSVLDIIWNYAPEFPKECADILEILFLGFQEIYTMFPTIADSYFGALQTSLDTWPFLTPISSLFFNDSSDKLLGTHTADVVLFCISVLENDQSTDPITYDKYLEGEEMVPVIYKTLETMLEVNEEEVTPIMNEYISEHIGEEETPSKFVTSMLANLVGKKMISNILYDDTGEYDTEQRQQILFALFQDGSPRVLEMALSEAAELISEDQLEPSEEILSLALQIFFSNTAENAEFAAKVIINIATSGKEGACETVISEMLQVIQKYEDVDKVSEALHIMTSIANKVSAESAVALLENAITLTQTLVSEHFTDPTISPCVGFVSQLIRTAGQECADYLPISIELATTLLQNDFEDDGMFLLSSLIDIFSESSPELIQESTSIILENINNPDNVHNLNALLTLTSSIINFISDPEALEHITVTCLEYISQPAPLIPISTKDIIVNLFAKMNTTAPEIISAHANDIMSQNKVILPLLSRANMDTTNMMINIASSMEDGCEYFNLLIVLLQLLRGIVRKTFRYQGDRAEVAMQILTLITQKAPESFSRLNRPINIVTYNELEKILNPEQQEFLHSICQKPELPPR